MSSELLFENDQSPVFYKHYPRLFHNYFKDVKLDLIDQLSRAGYLYYHSTLLTDSLIDDGQLSNITAITVLQEETIKTLTSIYGSDSEFWDYWTKRKEEYFRAVKIEQRLSYEKGVSLEEYEGLADKKSAFGKIAIDCLYVLDNKKNEILYKALLKSHGYFSMGFQLYDDVKDYREDFEKGQFNWAINIQKKEVYYQDFSDDLVSLNKLLFINGTAQKVMTLAKSYFQKAIDILNVFDIASEWHDVIREMKQTIHGYIDVTMGYIKTIERRIQIKENKYGGCFFFDYDNVRHKVVRDALHYIKGDYDQNYANLKHIMYLSSLEGFNNEEDVHASDVFQRAMLNDCLIDVCHAHKLNSTAFFDLECSYLIGQRNSDEIGAWSYFPSVKEIAADIDDLGQMMQFFVKSGNKKYIKDYCQSAIDLALSDRVTPIGGIETWIVPKENRNTIQEQQEVFNNTKWGKGPDVEVVANFVYALQMCNPLTYETHVEDSIPYILNNQDELGYWESRWYYGNYYGTYMCLRLLNCLDTDYSSNIQSALEYILEVQRDNGGFALKDEKEPDPLSTALALLSLRLFFNSDHEAIFRGLSFLRKAQQKDGSWVAVDFIRPKTQEPYKSKTLTTAFVIKTFSLCT